MVSQSVLLKGVNDDPVRARRADAGLRRNPDQALLPAPPGSGARHQPFPALTIEEGQALVASLRGRVSGLCQPTYILDIPGGHGKTVISAASIAADGGGCYTVTDFRGKEHAYPPKI